MKQVVFFCFLALAVMALPSAFAADELARKAPDAGASQSVADDSPGASFAEEEVSKKQDVTEGTAEYGGATVTVEKEDWYGPKGIIPVPGHLVVGPKLSAGIHPTPVLLGLEVKWNNQLGVGFDYGYFPDLTLDGVNFKFSAVYGTVRYYPWQRAFFVGVSFGKQTFTLSKTELGQTVTMEVPATVMTPHIGWRWMYDSGFFYGMELGWQLVLGHDVLQDPPGLTGSLVNEVRDKVDSYASQGLPRIALVQLGWMF